jgi:hypothetical protein
MCGCCASFKGQTLSVAPRAKPYSLDSHQTNHLGWGWAKESSHLDEVALQRGELQQHEQRLDGLERQQVARHIQVGGRHLEVGFQQGT